jgi:hypothetical protein
MGDRYQPLGDRLDDLVEEVGVHLRYGAHLIDQAA